MSGPFNLDHLHHFEPLSLSTFSNFLAFILGGQFLLPQRANNGEREFTQLQNWITHRGVSVPGAFRLFPLQPTKPLLFWKFYNFSTFILVGQFLLPQRANNQKREFSQLQKRMRPRGFDAWGILTGPFAAC